MKRLTFLFALAVCLTLSTFAAAEEPTEAVEDAPAAETQWGPVCTAYFNEVTEWCSSDALPEDMKGECENMTNAVAQLKSAVPPGSPAALATRFEGACEPSYANFKKLHDATK